MFNKCETEYIEKVERLIIDLKFQLSNQPQSIKPKDASALNEAHKNVDGARQKMKKLKSGAIMLGTGAGALVEAKIGTTFGLYVGFIDSLIGAVAGGLIGPGLAEVLIEILKMLDNAHSQREFAYGITHSGVH